MRYFISSIFINRCSNFCFFLRLCTHQILPVCRTNKMRELERAQVVDVKECGNERESELDEKWSDFLLRMKRYSPAKTNDKRHANRLPADRILIRLLFSHNPAYGH